MADWIDNLENWLGLKDDPKEKKEHGKPFKHCPECNGQERAVLRCRCGFRVGMCLHCFADSKKPINQLMATILDHGVVCAHGLIFTHFVANAAQMRGTKL